jgi:hypothetical protein
VTKAAHSLPDCYPDSNSNGNGTRRSVTSTPARQVSKRVVELPLLQQNFHRNMASCEDLAALRETRKATSYLLYAPPPNPVKHKTVTLSAWELGGWDTHGGGGRQRNSVGVERRHNDRHHLNLNGVFSNHSSSVFHNQRVPNCSLVRSSEDADNNACLVVNRMMNGKLEYDDSSTSSYDEDRLDRHQFEYILEQCDSSSGSSSLSAENEEKEEEESGTMESDAETFSAKAQRPSTAGTSGTLRQLETGASRQVGQATSPVVSPRQMTRGSTVGDAGEAWPSPIIPKSWPAVDDPYRFQYLGRGMVQDLKRRGRSKSQRKRIGGGVLEQPPLNPAPKTKLEVVVPLAQTECSVCGRYCSDCDHSTSNLPGVHSSHLPSVHPRASSHHPQQVPHFKSASSRVSMAMSVCTVQSNVAHCSQCSSVSPSHFQHSP